MSGRPVVALALATVISLLGTRLSMIAIPWLVLTNTGDPLLTGIIGFAEMLPYVLAKALCGPLIDRLGTRRIAIVGDLASMVAIAMVPLLHSVAGFTLRPCSQWLSCLVACVAPLMRLSSPWCRQSRRPTASRWSG